MLRALIRSLWNRLSRFVRRVDGDRVALSDPEGSRAVQPPIDRATAQAAISRYKQLIVSGVVRPGTGGDPFAGWPKPGEIRLPPGTSAELLDWLREDKR